MDTVIINTQPTSERNVAQLRCTLGNFDFMGPLRGPCLWVEMFNSNGTPFDAQYVRIDGPDWQNWPCDQTDEEDYEYISNVILNRLNLDKRHKLLFTTYPNSYSIEDGGNYNFLFETYSYPSGLINYQWQKDGVDISGAITNSYSINNAQISDVGIYNLIASNDEFTITGSVSLFQFQTGTSI